MKPITVRRETIADLQARELMYFARDLKERGFVAVLTLESGITASQAYVTQRGRIEHVAGSRALVDRYKEQQAKEVTP